MNFGRLVGRYNRGLARAMIALFCITQLYLANTTSLTSDEGTHIASGYTILTRHDFRFDADHPPLFKMLFALPVVLLHPNLPVGDEQIWATAAPTFNYSFMPVLEWSGRWIFATPGNDADLIAFLGRMAAVATSTALVGLIYWFARRYIGYRFALLSLLFVSTNPTLLAHGHLANTDVPLAFMALCTICLMTRYFQQPTLANAGWLALVVALGMLTKTSGIVLAAFAGATVLSRLPRIGWRNALGHACLAVFLGWSVLWAGYQFSSTYRPFDPSTAGTLLDSKRQEGMVALQNRFSQPFTTAAHVLPIAYIKSLHMLFINTRLGRTSYLFQSRVPGGRWYYFPVLYLLKTPLLATLLAGIGVIGWLGGHWRPISWRSLRPAVVIMTLVGGVFLFSAIRSKLNIGLRHIMPVIVLSTFAQSYGMVWLHRHRVPAAALAVVLAMATVIPVAWQFPHFINFSEPLLVRPASDAWKYFDDSNLDWGQQAKEIATTVSRQFPGQTVAVNYPWGAYILPYYGLSTRSFDPVNPPNGLPIVVTAGQLPYEEYAAFRELPPVARVDNTAFIYYINP